MENLIFFGVKKNQIPFTLFEIFFDIDLFKSYTFSLYVNHIIIRTDHLTTTPVLNQLKAMESTVFTALEAMKSVSY